MDTRANREKWVEALRSGEYEQGLGRLRPDTDVFCCLGVACEVFIKENPDGPIRAFGLRYVSRGGMSYDLTLPPDVQKWLGLRSSVGEFNGGEGLSSLSELNDEGVGFDKIANIIETINWEEVPR